ncbi:hypothetical protein ACFP81_06415 [Deinococcus lacus]|uniref:Uncharacterized protein n=1 Tax=Deinococcus lacus TaxID=392561 RepID=A0ABW1YFN0_9DEIO
MMDRAQALDILAEYAPALLLDGAGLLIDRHATLRVVGGVALTLYDPYAAALAYLMHPNTVKQRSEGGVSETYIDPVQVAEYLRQMSAQLQANWPLDDAVTAQQPNLDLTLDIRGWGA